jgi:hypothetical protein
MKYAVYVKFRRTDNGGDQWSGNQDRTDESREDAERATIENLKKHFQIEKVLKVISFQYENDEDAPDFNEETEHADMEERKEFALVEIADELRKINSSMDVYSMRIANKLARDDGGKRFMKIAAIASLIALGAQIALLLWLILR